jgi:hypothetical protein
MFGHNDTQQQTDPGQASTDAQAAVAGAPAVTADPVADGSLGTGTVGTVTPVTSSDEVDLQLPSSEHTVAPTADVSAPATASTVSAAPDDLLDIKQEALQQLSPLVGHLDQTPEERFRTTMMMIQATDDHTKIKEAYDAAKEITDDKTRAQALLDVVNEINYFTQQNHDSNQ